MLRSRCLHFAMLALCGLHVAAHAQSQGTLEERLRTQLRTLNAQNQQMSAERATLQASLRTAEGERDAARKELAGMKDELESSKQRAQGLAARQHQVEASAAAQTRQAEAKRDEQQQAARTLQQQLAGMTQERGRTADALRERDAQLQRCSAMNTDLQATAKEILDAYERFDVADAVSFRQPFAAKARVKLESQAQAYGDKLYDNKFDPRAVNVAPATTH